MSNSDDDYTNDMINKMKIIIKAVKDNQLHGTYLEQNEIKSMYEIINYLDDNEYYSDSEFWECDCSSCYKGYSWCSKHRNKYVDVYGCKKCNKN